MKTILHKANTRGHASHEWLESYHTFSFANYYKPDRVHFGVLRVINDDCVAAGEGFGLHPHDNMEVITIPLEGDLEHKDSMGHEQVIRYGDVQVMSAGTGIYHSEYNKNKDKPVKFLQIWIFPDKQSVAPRYGLLTLNVENRKNNLQQFISPQPNDSDEQLWIHQQAYLSIGIFDKGKTVDYVVQRKGNGVYAFVIKGGFTLAGEKLEPRDGIGIWETDKLSFTANDNESEILLIDVPMK